MRQLFIYLALIILSNQILNAQKKEDTLSFQHLKSGMSQSSATKIIEDSFGFLWIGTQNGVNKYDGKNFQIFKKSLDGITGLTNGYVEDIYEDNQGALYIATNQGLNAYDRDLDIVRPYPFKGEGRKLQSRHFTSVVKISNLLWLGTRNNGLYTYNIETGETRQLYLPQQENDIINKNHVVQISKIDKEIALMITKSAIYILTNKLKILSEIQEEKTIKSTLQVDNTNFLIGLQNGALIEVEISTDNSIHTKKTMISPEHSILSMALDKNGDYWLGSENEGLFIYSTTTNSISNLKTDNKKSDDISSNSIWSLYRDSKDVMWMGPFKQGLSFYDPEYYKFTHFKNEPFNPLSLSNNNVNCFSEDDSGNLWIGTDGGGLNYWDRSTNSFEHYSLENRRLNSNVVLSLEKGENNKLWIGSWEKGLTIFDTERKNYEVWTTKNSFLLSNNVMALLEDRKGRMWIVTFSGGVQVFDPKTNTHENIDIRLESSGTPVSTLARILEDKEGNIWIGSQTLGLYKVTEKENSWTYSHYHSLQNTKAISNDFINAIFEDQTGTIWVGTQAGLNKYNKATDSFKTIVQADGLSNDAIKGIIEDKDGLLWLSTGSGIIQYNPTNGNTLNYDVDDGLQGNEFNASALFKTSANEFVFGGSNGFNLFLPKDIQKRTDKPRVLISGLRISNQPVVANDDSKILKKHISQVDSVTLSYKHDVIDFEFNALTFRHPEKVNYAYFLGGFETDWNYVGHKKSATYTNLSSGEYTLRIKSSNSDGVWNDNETKLHITVTPPFWETWWFRSLLAASLIFGFYLMHYIKINNVKKHQITLERKIDERTSQLRQQKKKLEVAADELASKNEEIQRFAFAVSHDLKSPLSGIKGIASLIPMEFVMKDFPELEKYLEMINISCDTMNDLIADITKIARLGKIENKTEVLNTNEIIDLSITLVKGKLDAKNVKLKIDDNLPSIHGDRNRIIQVFGNLLDNAIKYMGDQQNPLVCIETQENGDKIQFSVKDNGSGMSEQDLKKLFSPFERFHANVTGTGLGLYMIKQIVESHGGNIHAESDGKGKGATFVVALPNPINEQNQDKIQDELISEVTY